MTAIYLNALMMTSISSSEEEKKFCFTRKQAEIIFSCLDKEVKDQDKRQLFSLPETSWYQTPIGISLIIVGSLGIGFLAGKTIDIKF